MVFILTSGDGSNSSSQPEFKVTTLKWKHWQDMVAVNAPTHINVTAGVVGSNNLRNNEVTKIEEYNQVTIIEE